MVKAGRSPSEKSKKASDAVARGAKWQREGVQRVSSVITTYHQSPPTADLNLEREQARL